MCFHVTSLCTIQSRLTGLLATVVLHANRSTIRYIIPVRCTHARTHARMHVRSLIHTIARYVNSDYILLCMPAKLDLSSYARGTPGNSHGAPGNSHGALGPEHHCNLFPKST